MNTITQRLGSVQFLVILGLVVGLFGIAPAMAGQSKADKKKAFDAAAEAKQAAQEEADMEAARLKGVLFQKLFQGTFMLLGGGEKEDQPNPEVIGSFLTDSRDQHPGMGYLVKVAGNKAQVVEALKRNNGKKVTIQGITRNEQKYLIVNTVEETASTPPPKARSGGKGGI